MLVAGYPSRRLHRSKTSNTFLTSLCRIFHGTQPRRPPLIFFPRACIGTMLPSPTRSLELLDAQGIDLNAVQSTVSTYLLRVWIVNSLRSKSMVRSGLEAFPPANPFRSCYAHVRRLRHPCDPRSRNILRLEIEMVVCEICVSHQSLRTSFCIGVSSSPCDRGSSNNG